MDIRVHLKTQHEKFENKKSLSRMVRGILKKLKLPNIAIIMNEMIPYKNKTSGVNNARQSDLKF